MSYNGWANYATWYVYTFWTDEGNAMRNFARETYAEEYEARQKYLANCEFSNCNAVMKTPKYIRVHALQETADALKYELYNILYSEGFEQTGGLLEEFVEIVMDKIDFYELAESFVPDEEE